MWDAAKYASVADVFSMPDWGQFFADNAPPENIEENQKTVREFCHQHTDKNIVLVTSGKVVTGTDFLFQIFKD
jgi:hypothetical protein